ncbi:MAG: lipoprotein insertase outer membrane protein LolB [Luteimonas sp.]
MSVLRGRYAAIAVAALLSACVVQPVRQAPPVPRSTAETAQAGRESVLSTHAQWSLQGRVALSNGHNGGSGRIDWRQYGPRYEVALSAPVTRQSWRLRGAAGSARLEGLAGGPREGTDAEALLREATGWVIPVAALSSWVRGATDSGLGPATLQFGADGHLARLQQAGWMIDYDDWRLQAGLGVELPHRLNASQGDARVRLVVDQWSEGAASP